MNVIERLLIGGAIWIVALAILALQRRFVLRNLALIACGSALVLVAAAIDPEAAALIGLGGIGAILWQRGVDAERRRTRPRRAAMPETAPR